VNTLFEQHLDSSRPVLVLINGLLADYTSYDSLAFLARESFHVLRYNTCGQDLVEKDTNELNKVYSLQDHVHYLSSVLEKHKINVPIYLCGLSNGGRIALKYAELFPQNVKKVAAFDTYDQINPMLALKLNSWKMAHQVGGAVHRFDISSPWIWGESFFNEKKDFILGFRQKILDGINHNISMEVSALINGALKDDDDFDRVILEKIQCPVLLGVGAEDLLTTVSAHREMLKKLQQGTFLEMENTGHASLVENPMIMKKNILPFFLED
jgi:3-oxoadipate enol-lactonase